MTRLSVLARPTGLHLLVTASLAATSLVATGCNNDCDFHERCNGDVREVCAPRSHLQSSRLSHTPVLG